VVDKLPNHISPLADAMRFPFETPLVGLATGTLTSTILEKFLHVGGKTKATCALSLENQLTSYRLTDPVLFMEHGENPMPVPLKIATNSTTEIVFEAAGDKDDTSGLLFYKIETTGHLLRIFWKVSGSAVLSKYTSNRFDVEIIRPEKFFDNEKSLQALYSEVKAYSEPTERANAFTVTDPPILLRVPGRSATKDPLKITIRTQMSTGKDGKLSVSISDNLSNATQTPLHKRAAIETTVALGLMSTVLNVMFKKVGCFVER
jgi:hypothetical protein